MHAWRSSRLLHTCTVCTSVGKAKPMLKMLDKAIQSLRVVWFSESSFDSTLFFMMVVSGSALQNLGSNIAHVLMAIWSPATKHLST